MNKAIHCFHEGLETPQGTKAKTENEQNCFTVWYQESIV